MTSRVGVGLLFGAVLLAGCASAVDDSPAASPAFTPRAECERNGGWWRDSLGFCEYQTPGFPFRR
jgi:hypothetical protein